MKKQRCLRLLGLALSVLLLCGALPFSASAADGYTRPEKWRLNGINTECRTEFLVAYTGTGKTGTGEKCTDVTVGADGKVIAVCKNNAEIPEGGFVLSGSGSKAKTLGKLAAGDGLWLDTEELLVVMVPKDYREQATEVTIRYTGVNGTRVADSTILYDHGGTTTGTNDYGYEVVVDADGYVTAVGTNNSAIPVGGYVISGHGKGKTALQGTVGVGNKAELDRENNTVVFRTDEEIALHEIGIYAETLSARKNAAKAAGKLLDYDRLDTLCDEINGLHGDCRKALQDKDTFRQIVAYYRYGNKKAECETALNETPAVEARAVWIRPDLVTNKEQVYKTVKKIYEAGFNQVYVELLYDNTTIMPVPESSYYTQNPKLKGADLLAFYVEACHAYRIEIHGWYSACRVGYKGSANTLYCVAMKKPEWKQISKNGVDFVENAYGDAYFVNPALPEVREFLLSTCEYLAENYALDGLHLDYIRYPNKNDGEDFGYDEYTRNAYKGKAGIDPKTLSPGTSAYTDFCKFRADYVSMLVGSISKMLKEKRPDMVLSAAVAPDYNTSLQAMCQDPTTWIKNGYLDAVLPMAYGSTDMVEHVVEKTDPLGTALGIYGVSDQGADILKEQITATREKGASGFGFFSWNVYGTKYQPVSDTLLAEKVPSPLWNAKASVQSLLRTSAKRLSMLGKSDLQKQCEDVADKLETSSLSSREAELKALLALLSKVNGLTAEQQALLSNDANRMTRILAHGRDDAKAEYLKTHPLPESRIEETKDDPKETSGVSDVSSEEESSEPEKVKLNPVEKIAQVISLVVIFGGLLLFPVYFILNKRKKRIHEEYEEAQNDGQNGENA